MNINKVKSKERKYKAIMRKKAKREANVDLTKRAHNAERALLKREHILAIAELKKAWKAKPSVKLKRGRKTFIETSPKPVGLVRTLDKKVKKDESIAREKAMVLKRAKIKLYNAEKSETKKADLIDEMRFNVVVSKKFPAEFRLRDIKARERELKAIALRGKVEVKPTSSSKCTPRFYKTKRVEALKVLRESNLKAVA